MLVSSVQQCDSVREREREREGRERDREFITGYQSSLCAPWVLIVYLFYILQQVSVNPKLLSYSSLPLPSQPQSVLYVCRSASFIDKFTYVRFRVHT